MIRLYLFLTVSNLSLQSQSHPRNDGLAAQFSELNVADENPVTDHTNLLGAADISTVLLTTTLADEPSTHAPSGFLPHQAAFSLDATRESICAIINNQPSNDIPTKISNGWTRKAENIIVAVEHNVRQAGDMLSFADGVIPISELTRLLDEATQVVKSAGMSLVAINHPSEAVQSHKTKVISMLRNLDARISQLGGTLPLPPLDTAPLVVDARESIPRISHLLFIDYLLQGPFSRTPCPI